MPWTEITQPQYDRRTLGYASDSADKQWAIDRTVHARWLQSRAFAPDADAQGLGCDPVDCGDGLPMGAFAPGFSAFHDRAVLHFRRMRGDGSLAPIDRQFSVWKFWGPPRRSNSESMAPAAQSWPPVSPAPRGNGLFDLLN